MIKIKNKKLVTLLLEKDKLVKEGRAISVEMEKIEKDINKCEDKEKAITAKVNPTELVKQADAMQEEINTKIKQFEEIANEITKIKLAAIPKDLEQKHRDLMSTREKLERDRNKIALKIQKIKDRVIPVIQEKVVPMLKEYEDISTADVKDGEVVVTTFSHLEDWKKAFEERRKK